MKTTKKTIEITSETSDSFVIRLLTPNRHHRCEQCQKEVRLLTPEAAANIAGVTQRTIYRLIEAKQIHFTETDGGHLLVCLDSLSREEALKQ